MKHRVGLIALLAMLLSPPGASGQENYREWLGLCLGPDAGFQACANISIWTRYDPVREYTYATYQVSNLQGWAPYLTNSGPTSLYAFQIHGIEYNPPSWRTDLPYYANSFRRGEVSTLGHADLLGISQHERFGFGSFVEGDGVQGSRLYGCEGPPQHISGRPVGADDYGQFVGVETCHGALQIEYEWAGRITLAEGAWAGFAATADGPGGDLYAQCGPDCITVTPEPSTWFMLATGLLGLGWFARRRKAGEGTETCLRVSR